MPSGRKVTKEDQRRRAVKLALEEIKPIVRRLGTSPIYGALRQLHQQEKKREKLVELKQKVAELEEEVANG